MDGQAFRDKPDRTRGDGRDHPWNGVPCDAPGRRCNRRGDIPGMAPEAPASGVAVAPGSCGEMVQGSVDGVDFLVTCPINIYSRVSVVLRVQAGADDEQSTGGVGARGGSATDLTAAPRPGPCLPKTRHAVGLTLARLGLAGCVTPAIHVLSTLPHGKGMGSSTADISAAVAATCAAAGAGVAPDEIARIALSIEPSDGTMFDGIVQFDHRCGRITRPLGPPPPIDILILDPGGEVDTLIFNANPRLPDLNKKKEREVAEALFLVEEGLKNQDPSAIGQGCTLSAVAHQFILPKPHLDEVIDLADDVGAVGVNVAHSGTVMGLLFDPRTADVDDLEAFVRPRVPWARVLRARLVGGGVRAWGEGPSSESSTGASGRASGDRSGGGADGYAKRCAL